jgi:hypothetical protein
MMASLADDMKRANGGLGHASVPGILQNLGRPNGQGNKPEDRPRTPPVIRVPSSELSAAIERLCPKRPRTVILPQKIPIRPSLILFLDQAVVMELYQRGHVDLLPLMRAMGMIGPNESGHIRSFQECLAPAQMESRSSHKASVTTSGDGAESTTKEAQNPDMLKDAICGRFPELRTISGQLVVKKRAGSIDIKRYRQALRPKVIAPDGRLEKSVFIRHLMHRFYSERR